MYSTMQALGKPGTLLINSDGICIARFVGRHHERDALEIAEWLAELDQQQSLAEWVEMMTDHGCPIG